MKGKQIKTVEQIFKHKSVWHERWGRSTPVAWLGNMQARLVHNYVKMGWIYEYKVKK